MESLENNITQTNAPIAIFAYNRPTHLARCLNSLLENEEFYLSQIWIFQDGAKDFNDNKYKETTEIICDFVETNRLSANIKFIKRNSNYGLQNSILKGIDEVFEKSTKIIVVEDDLQLSRYFLKYCNYYLNKYQHEPKVASIQGYTYPQGRKIDKPYFLKGADCWGWATWKNRWIELERESSLLLDELKARGEIYAFDFNGSFGYSNMLFRQSKEKANSWAIRWHASMYLRNKLSLYPPESLVINLGGDGTGTNMMETNIYDVSLSEVPILESYIPPKESKEIRRSIIKYFRKNNNIPLFKVAAYWILNQLNLYEKVVLK